jgi:hypothetical protein
MRASCDACSNEVAVMIIAAVVEGYSSCSANQDVGVNDSRKSTHGLRA